MKRVNGIIVLGLALMLALPAIAEDGPPVGVWQKQVEIGVNLLQSSYSKNWNGGDKGSIVWSGVIDAVLEKQFNDKTNWRNSLNLAYGQTHSQDRDGGGALYWQRPDKTTDNVAFESLFRWTTSSGWDPFLAFNFDSLFEDLTADPMRPMTLNPMKFKESAGISRTLIENENQVLMTRLGVAFIQNSRKYYPNVAPDDMTESTTSTEAAAEMITEYKTKVLEDRVEWDSKLTFSLPFSYSEKSVFEDEMVPSGMLPEDIADYSTALDVDFENTFTTNITKVISVKLFVRWVYDKYDNSVSPVVDEDGMLLNEDLVAHAIRKSGQFKQTLALGFGYKFN